MFIQKSLRSNGGIKNGDVKALKHRFHRIVIVKSCDSSRFWLIVEKLTTIENKNVTEIGSDLQPRRFLSQIVANLFVR